MRTLRVLHHFLVLVRTDVVGLGAADERHGPQPVRMGDERIASAVRQSTAHPVVCTVVQLRAVSDRRQVCETDAASKNRLRIVSDGGGLLNFVSDRSVDRGGWTTTRRLATAGV